MPKHSTSSPANNLQEQAAGQFKPGKSGNPKGRQPGSRNKATLAAQALLDGEAEAITRKAIELALDGDLVALRLCLERIVAPRRDRPMTIKLPALNSAADLPTAFARIASAVSAGQVSAEEAEALSDLFENYRRAIETAELEEGIAALEEGGSR